MRMEGQFNRFRTAIEVAMVVYIVMLSRNYICPFASALAFGAALSELKFSNGPVAWHWHLAFHEEELALPTLGNTPRARGTSRRRLGA